MGGNQKLIKDLPQSLQVFGICLWVTQQTVIGLANLGEKRLISLETQG